MFWKNRRVEETAKPKVKKLPRPMGMFQLGMYQLLPSYLMYKLKQKPERLWRLCNVMRPRSDSKYRFDFQVFDKAQVAARKVKVKDYNSLDEFPDLVVYKGWFDTGSGKVQIEEKKVD